MIVLYTEAGWRITTQRSHGILAAQIAMHWKDFPVPDRWLEALLAIAEHDDAENELDGENLLTANGGPLNYKMKKFELAHCEKLASYVSAKSQFIYLITSLHMEFLYRRDAAKNKDAKRFLADQKKIRASICKNLHISKTTSEKIYSLLEWCDAFSLLLCEQGIPPEHRKIEISSGPDEIIYELSRLNDNTLNVDPWPFRPESFILRFEMRNMKDMKFESSAEFRTKFIREPIIEIVYTISKKTTAYRKKKKV